MRGHPTSSSMTNAALLRSEDRIARGRVTDRDRDLSFSAGHMGDNISHPNDPHGVVNQLVPLGSCRESACRSQPRISFRKLYQRCDEAFERGDTTIYV